jgi:anti-anti-sigma factor
MTRETDNIEVRIEDLEDQPRTKVIRLAGSLEARSIARVNQAVLPLIQTGIVNLIFDCRRLSFVTSPALGILINYYKRTREMDGTTKFFGLEENILDIFRIVGLTKTFEIYATRDEAIRSLRQPAHA